MSVTAIAARARLRRCSFSAPSPPSSPSSSSLCTSPTDLAQAMTVTDHPPQLRSVQKVVASSGLENGRAFLDSSSHPPTRSLCSRLAPAGAVDLAAVDQTVSSLQALPLRGPSSATCATTSADGDRQPSSADGDRRPSSCVVAQCDDPINGRKCPMVAPSEEEGWRVKTARSTMDARLDVAPAQPPLLSSSIKQVMRATCPPLGGGNQVGDHFVEEGEYVDQSGDTKYLDRANDFALGNQPIGSIHVIVGPMFAGKTTALLKRMEEEASKGRYGKTRTVHPISYMPSGSCGPRYLPYCVIGGVLAR
ncbi:hypothetical protein CBR_g4521 [Chara braunii]|uniref:thymidine kinase n=1 Tax=Chara braunii TaxID=69332 RepID=A0A388KI14_CHABU|nr:hypothetical protein CBR_g4521 [Chara braunii]|eukprot:GBG69691.1 hypothetical protein CBR_g4521 [Chara braunii]